MPDLSKPTVHAVYGELMWPEYSQTAERHGTSQEEAFRLLDELIAEVRADAFREAADLIDAKAAAVLDAIPEDEQNPSDQDRYQEWLSAGDVLRAEVKAAPPEPAPAACRCGADPVHQMGCDAE
jgi:hypothetical protein